MSGSRLMEPARACAVRAPSSPDCQILVAVGIVPGVGGRLARGVRVRVAADGDAGVVPEQAVVRLQHRPAVTRQVERRADARGDLVPGVEILLRERLGGQGDRAQAERQLLLLRQRARVAVVAQPRVDSETAERPGIVDEQREHLQRRRCRQCAFAPEPQPADLAWRLAVKSRSGSPRHWRTGGRCRRRTAARSLPTRSRPGSRHRT